MNDPVNAGADVNMNASILAAIYADLSSIGKYLADDAVLHPAETDSLLIVGRDAIVEHEKALIRATGGTLVMHVQTIATSTHFGAVLGTFLALRDTADDDRERAIAMPFCGLWRFRDEEIVEHWENAYNPRILAAFLQDHD